MSAFVQIFCIDVNRIQHKTEAFFIFSVFESYYGQTDTGTSFKPTWLRQPLIYPLSYRGGHCATITSAQPPVKKLHIHPFHCCCCSCYSVWRRGLGCPHITYRRRYVNWNIFLSKNGSQQNRVCTVCPGASEPCIWIPAKVWDQNR